MSGTFDRRPELMIVIAVAVACLLGLFSLVGGCTVIASTAANAASEVPFDPGDVYDGYDDYDDYGDILDDLFGDGLDELFDGDGEGDGSYTEDDVPAAMDIDVPELQDDLQAMVNYDLEHAMGLDADQDIEVIKLTKDDVAQPALKNGQVLCQVNGKATITNAAGDTDTIDYTSYYYAADPTAEKITWYIYAYDLGAYGLFPDGFELKSGDPLGYRGFLLDGDASSELSRDRGRDAEKA